MPFTEAGRALLAHDDQLRLPELTYGKTGEPIIEAIEAEAFAAGVAAARERIEAIDLGIYPKMPDGSRPDLQTGWNNGVIAMEEAIEEAWAALAAIDAIGAGETHRGSDPYVTPDGLPPTNPPDSNARQENP